MAISNVLAIPIPDGPQSKMVQALVYTLPLSLARSFQILSRDDRSLIAR